jgi:ketosteroid isomerase-like protein
MARTDIDALNATFQQGLEKGDADLLASVYAPDARLFPPGSEVVEGPAIRELWQGFLDSGVDGG